MLGQELYKLDSNDNIRIWFLEYDEEKYRTHSGVKDGKIVISGWKYPEEKNVGKINGTSVAQQVLAEIESMYTKQKYQGGYHETIDSTSDGMKFFKPMLAKKVQDEKFSFPVYSSPKLDGVRAIVTKNSITSRQGKPILSAPHILENLKGFFEQFPNMILDGELYNHTFKHDFEKIISLARKSKPTAEDLEESSRLLEFHCYDVPMAKDYTERFKFLTEHVADKYSMVVLVDATIINDKEQMDKFLGDYLESGYEGQMIRIPKGPYENKRSKTLLKNKEFEDDEFEIIEILEGVGNWAGYAKSVYIKLDNGLEQDSGMKGNFNFAKEILEQKDALVGTTVTVRFQGRTGIGKLRFPVVQTFWKGKRDV